MPCLPMDVAMLDLHFLHHIMSGATAGPAPCIWQKSKRESAIATNQAYYYFSVKVSLPFLKNTLLCIQILNPRAGTVTKDNEPWRYGFHCPFCRCHKVHLRRFSFHYSTSL